MQFDICVEMKSWTKPLSDIVVRLGSVMPFIVAHNVLLLSLYL